ncbi:hypothetical protein [Glycomyces arizonensis]|uniref:hypothetical protein n=1 Tax=Glycomyces arizonensis TaxID=256035 RepID=UPI000407DBD9|nr:hypothetical protein [Glycomyces arizonensis]
MIIGTLLASIVAMVIAFMSDRPNTIAVAAALITLMTLVATVVLQPLPKGRGLLQDQLDWALRRLEPDVRRFWNTEAADRGLIDDPSRTACRFGGSRSASTLCGGD